MEIRKEIWVASHLLLLISLSLYLPSLGGSKYYLKLLPIFKSFLLEYQWPNWSPLSSKTKKVKETIISSSSIIMFFFHLGWQQYFPWFWYQTIVYSHFTALWDNLTSLTPQKYSSDKNSFLLLRCLYIFPWRVTFTGSRIQSRYQSIFKNKIFMKLWP